MTADNSRVIMDLSREQFDAGPFTVVHLFDVAGDNGDTPLEALGRAAYRWLRVHETPGDWPRDAANAYREMVRAAETLRQEEGE